jgi:hypothetical protein
MMLHRLTTQLPEWARPEHPAMRHVLGAPMQGIRRGLILQLVASLLLLTLAVIGSGVTGQNVALPISEVMMNSLLPAVFIGQLFLSLLVIVYTSGIVTSERRRQTWDTLRTTRNGVGLALRARWSAAIFYRLAGFLIALLLARVVLVGLLVFDLTAFGGDYLAIISGGGVVPTLPLPVVVVLVAFTMAASFILPLTGLGLDAAVGLLLSTFIRNRVFLVLAQVIVGLARFALSAGLLWLVLNYTSPATMPSNAFALGTMVGYGAFGDWGLHYLNLAYYSELWANVPYGIFVGAGLLITAFLQALLADGLVTLAVRRGEIRD